MADHNPLPISGYKPQSEMTVALVNQNKHSEEKLLRLMDDLKNGTTPDGETISIDQRWLAIARTQIEQGFMALNRSIFQPGRIEGEI